MINKDDFLQHELRRMFENRLKDRPKTLESVLTTAAEIADFLDIEIIVHDQGINVFIIEHSKE